jgi:diguanylate cyclase (GGDEF)-like protein
MSRILVVEDEPAIAELISINLRHAGFEVTIAGDAEQAQVAVDGILPSLVVLDWMLPGQSGHALARAWRGQPRTRELPIIMLTARAAESDKISGLDAGADDYLTKPFKGQELRVRIHAGRRLLDLQDALREQATHDGLTGLLNRNSILGKLQEETERGERDKHPVAVLMADLDKFKSINDTYGHLAGDAVLREAAHRMKSAMRRYDAIGRYGGEEFLIVLPGCNSADAYRQAERLREAMGGMPFALDTVQLKVTCSYGLASTDQAAPAGLLREADEALYAAKAQGRNRVGLLPLRIMRA